MLGGILLSAILAIMAYVIQGLPFAPFTLASGAHPVDAVLVAIVLGLLVGNVWPTVKRYQAGIDFSSKNVLSVAIVLLGAGLNVHDLFALPWLSLGVLVIAVVAIFFITRSLGRLFGVASKTTVLVAIGTAICGSSAIAAAAPTINADQHDVALSITTINLVGLVAIVIFPVLGHFLRLNDTVFGLWAGISIQAVPQVVAAGILYGPLAAKVATVVKLVRVLLLAPFVLWLKVHTVRTNPTRAATGQVLWQQFLPPFILFFMLMVLLRAIGVVRDVTLLGQAIPLLWLLSKTSGFLMSMALGAIGLKTDLNRCFSAGLSVWALALVAAIILALISLVLLTLCLV